MRVYYRSGQQQIQSMMLARKQSEMQRQWLWLSWQKKMNEVRKRVGWKERCYIVMERRREGEEGAEQEPVVLCCEAEQSTADQIVGLARRWAPNIPANAGRRVRTCEALRGLTRTDTGGDGQLHL